MVSMWVASKTRTSPSGRDTVRSTQTMRPSRAWRTYQTRISSAVGTASSTIGCAGLAACMAVSRRSSRGLEEGRPRLRRFDMTHHVGLTKASGHVLRHPPPRIEERQMNQHHPAAGLGDHVACMPVSPGNPEFLSRVRPVPAELDQTLLQPLKILALT